jgi:CspA family cold shock protein
MSERHTGTLKFWNIERGFGFIERADGEDDVFLGSRALDAAGIDPSEGMKLSFTITEDRAGRLQADNVAKPFRACTGSAGALAAMLRVCAPRGVIARSQAKHLDHFNGDGSVSSYACVCISKRQIEPRHPLFHGWPQCSDRRLVRDDHADIRIT